MPSSAARCFPLLLLAAIFSRGPLPAAEGDPFREHVRSTEPLTPAAQRESFTLPPGFEIQLVAAEPHIAKPLNMAFDLRGRLWITQTVEYPHPVPLDQAGRDAVKILEDTNGDGRADRITTFAEGLNIPIGLYPYQEDGRDAALVFSIPHIWKLVDRDGDGAADERTPLYGPFGWERDTHGLNNSFRRGWDGWLHACHGFNNNTSVAGTDGHRVTMHSGNTYRLRLDGSRIEQFTWGQVNPFGMAMDPRGNLFTADCHSKPLYQLVKGGYYPSFGKPHDGLGFVPEMMQHSHGSTAIAGAAWYGGTNFPEEYRGNLFCGNVMTSRVNRNRLERRGSTTLAREAEDFVVTRDPWFRPVDLQVGPDGALYIADFYNRVIGHYEVPLNHPGRDRERGRIWRVVYTGDAAGTTPAVLPPDLTVDSAARCTEALRSENLTYRLLATDWLSDEAPESTVRGLREGWEREPAAARAHRLWILHRRGLLETADLLRGLGDDDPLVRLHATRLLAGLGEWPPAVRESWKERLAEEEGEIRRAAVEAASAHPSAEAAREILRLVVEGAFAGDPLGEYVLRKALRDQLLEESSLAALRGADLNDLQAAAVAEAARAAPSAAAAAWLAEYLKNAPRHGPDWLGSAAHVARYAEEEPAAAVAETIRERFAAEPDFQARALHALLDARAQRGSPPPPSWRAWGESLAGTLLAQKTRAIPWSHHAVEGLPESDSPWTPQQRASADRDSQGWFYSSLPRGEQLTGVWRSAEFELPQQLVFFLAGHDGVPNQPPRRKNKVLLREAGTGELLREQAPPRNDTAQRIVWDLGDSAGGRGYLELVDGDSAGAYAWLAVGRFSLPELNPSPHEQGRQLALRLIERLGLKDWSDSLYAELAKPETEPGRRVDLARALAGLRNDATLTAFAPLLGEPLPAAAERGILQLYAPGPRHDAQGAVLQALAALSSRRQAEVAAGFCGDAAGRARVIDLMEQGKLPGALVREPAIGPRLLADAALRERAAKIQDALPEVDPARAARLQARLTAFRQRGGDSARGAEVFAKNCAGCHQLAGKGGVIGPQLDGIGLRGVERLAEDVLDPNRNVDINFRVTLLVLVDGRIVSGLVRREEGRTLVLADPEGKEFSIPLAEIEERRESNLSLMPANFGDNVPDDDLFALWAYLLEQTAPPMKE